MSVELGGSICILQFTLAGLELLFILIWVLSDGVVAMITLSLLGSAVSSEGLDTLSISMRGQTQAFEDLIVVTSVSCMEELLDVDCELNSIAGWTST